jgi:hypothetical protein
MTTVTITKQDVSTGLTNSLSSLKTSYANSSLATNSLLNYNYGGLTIASNDINFIKQTISNQNVFNRFYTNLGSEVKSGLYGIALDMGERFLSSQKNVNISFTRTLKQVIAQGYTMEQAISKMLGSEPIEYVFT